MSLAQYVGDMLTSEGEIETTLTRLPPGLYEHPEMADLVQRLHATTRRHQNDLRRRLKTASLGKEQTANKIGSSQSPDRPLDNLRALYGLLAQAALGYAILHAVAHRYFDGPQEGTTAELAENHLKDYAEVVSSINSAISDVTTWEIGRLGQECQCECPSCGLGICLCSPHGMNTVVDVWRESASLPTTRGAGGMRVRPPRRGSPASDAKIQPGDFVVAVDDCVIKDESWESIKTMQDAIRGHRTGEAVRLRVRRESGTVDEVPLVR